MNTFQQEATQLGVQHKIKKLFNSSFFDICTLRDLGALLEVDVRQHPDYPAMCKLHCINYSEMTPEFKSQLQQSVVNMLRGDESFNVDHITKVILHEGRDNTPTEDIFLDQEPSTSEKKSKFLSFIGGKEDAIF